MKIYQMQTIATVLWVLMGLFFALSIALFFAWNIKKAWKIIMGTDFKVPVIKGFRGTGALTGNIGSRNLGSRNLGSRNPGSKNPGSKNLGSKNLGSKNLGSKNLGSKNLGSKKLSSKRLGFDSSDPKSKKLNGKNPEMKGVTLAGETVALEKYMQTVNGNPNILVQKGMSNVVETSILTNPNIMDKTANESMLTAVLKREELEVVVDIMFIHTEEII